MSDDGDTPHDWEKKQWQQEQLARDADQEKRRLKDEKARIRRARSAQRQLKKAKQQLDELGEITDWEEEFITSVDERLDKYDAAFHDRTKGAASDALSVRQKQVLAQMRRKIKDKTRGKLDGSDDKDKPAPKRWGSSFKRTSEFIPRVRHIEDDMGEDDDPPPSPPAKGKPSLRIIKGGKD
ncbi:MAG TPA: hypothetical protein ENJ46_04405 [Hellea balneolensis]|uniref:Uncharacterized protein n=1 Tax=Hellea balneolensis TaxID=287478 RepID=A0A7C3C9N3_9PROT|nr:hypothetical protein [Hellea balneolensis]